MDGGDLSGGEELLHRAIGERPDLAAFFHFQFGRLYARWNKLTSATNHLNLAAELAHSKGDELFTIQVVNELSEVRRRQAEQRP
ncbi:MAG TPA: hypothetical protein PKC28_06885 [Bdellovibrionales bacterium]|nr:hypothetical protein [Bdellovibrionales bacterium]